MAGSGAVPDVFSGMRDIPSVTDGYAAYAYLPAQSCLIHMLRRAEKCAVRSGKGPDLIPCLPLLGMHSRVKRTETAPPGPRRNRMRRCGRSPTRTGAFRTAENLGVRPSAVARMTARGPGWDMSARADGPGPPLGAQARQPFRAPREAGPERPGHGL